MTDAVGLIGKFVTARRDTEKHELVDELAQSLDHFIRTRVESGEISLMNESRRAGEKLAAAPSLPQIKARLEHLLLDRDESSFDIHEMALDTDREIIDRTFLYPLVAYCTWLGEACDPPLIKLVNSILSKCSKQALTWAQAKVSQAFNNKGWLDSYSGQKLVGEEFQLSA